MSCYATADSPPKYVEFEGPFVVGVQPPDPTACIPVPQTLLQLQQQACAKQGMAFDGNSCVASTPEWKQWWFWLILFFIVVAIAMFFWPRRSATQRVIRFPMN